MCYTVNTMVRFENVTKIYPPKTVAVKNITLALSAGEFVSLIGSSGSGKTTLVKLLTGEEQPTVGSVFLGEVEINKLRRAQLSFLRRQIGVVFQDYKLLEGKTVFENVAFALAVCGATQPRIREVVPQVLQVVGLQEVMHRFPHQLSGGEAQRVVIARAMVNQPALLIADEPTGNLDPLHAKEVIDTLLNVNNLGTTVLLITHNKDTVNKLKKRVVVLEQGEMISDTPIGKYKLA